MRHPSFDLDQFVNECQAALRDTSPQAAVCELVKKAVYGSSSLISSRLLFSMEKFALGRRS